MKRKREEDVPTYNAWHSFKDKYMCSDLLLNDDLPLEITQEIIRVMVSSQFTRTIFFTTYGINSYVILTLSLDKGIEELRKAITSQYDKRDQRHLTYEYMSYFITIKGVDRTALSNQKDLDNLLLVSSCSDIIILRFKKFPCHDQK